MKKKLRLGALTCPGSKGGLQTFLNILGQEIDFSVLELGETPASYLPSDYDGFFVHNTFDVPNEVLKNSLLYIVNAAAKRLLRNERLSQRVIDNLPKTIWCTCQSISEDLAAVGISAIPMYRPAPNFKTPSTYSPLPQSKSILWYFKPDHIPIIEQTPAIINSLNQIDDVKIYLFPAEQSPVSKSNIHALGRIDLNEWLPKVRGLVRISSRLDFGRSTFDALGYGRWVLYLNMKEQDMFSVNCVEDVPQTISRLVEEERDKECYERFQRSKRLDPDMLQKVWLDKINSLFTL